MDAEPQGGTPPSSVAVRGARSRTPLLTWGTVALVLVIVVILVVFKLTGTSTTATSDTTPVYQAAPAAVVQAVTGIRPSVFDAVGVASPDAAVTPPTTLHGQPALTSGGKPEVLFVGSEPCPYCAAMRWAVVAALSRFGTFSGLDSMQSASSVAFGGTPTFTFVATRYKSRYVTARLLERYGMQKNSAGTSYAVLEPLDSSDRALLARYGDPAPGAGPLLPFLDVGNRAVVDGGSFSPAILQQLSASEIATGLSDARDPSTQAIVASANYISASICAADGERPATVCGSRGVAAAATAMDLGS